jgi:hypothetical protein
VGEGGNNEAAMMITGLLPQGVVRGCLPGAGCDTRDTSESLCAPRVRLLAGVRFPGRPLRLPLPSVRPAPAATASGLANLSQPRSCGWASHRSTRVGNLFNTMVRASRLRDVHGFHSMPAVVVQWRTAGSRCRPYANINTLSGRGAVSTRQLFLEAGVPARYLRGLR